MGCHGHGGDRMTRRNQAWEVVEKEIPSKGRASARPWEWNKFGIKRARLLLEGLNGRPSQSWGRSTGASSYKTCHFLRDCWSEWTWSQRKGKIEDDFMVLCQPFVYVWDKYRIYPTGWGPYSPHAVIHCTVQLIHEHHCFFPIFFLLKWGWGTGS